MSNNVENTTAPNKVRISRGEFLQHFTDIFIRNNRNELYARTNQLIISLGQIPENMDLDDIIDKAVFASMLDLCSKNMMEKQDSFATIVQGHLFTITEYQIQLKNQSSNKNNIMN